MAIIEWDEERFRLGIDTMDDTHVEFVALVNKMEQADSRAFVNLFDTLVDHTRAHFERERQLMVKSKFPATSEHCSDHDLVLGELEKFSLRVHKGLVAFGRNYVRDRIAHWFPLHAATMDSALAAHIKSVSGKASEATG